MLRSCTSSTPTRRSTRRAHHWRPSSLTHSTLPPSLPEPHPLPESVLLARAEAEQWAQEVPVLPALPPQVLPLESPEPQAEVPERESPALMEARSLPPLPPLLPLLW